MYWFNEGATSFAGQYYLERICAPFRRQLRSSLRFSRDLARTYWQRHGDDPVLARLAREELLGPAPYGKGQIVMTALRVELGRDEAGGYRLFTALRQLMEDPRYRFGNIEPDDVEAAVSEVAGRDMRWFFDQWIYGRGMAVVRYGCQTRTIAEKTQVDCTFRQVQNDVDQLRDFLLKQGATPPERPWNLFRLTIPIYYSEDSTALEDVEACSVPFEAVTLEAVPEQTISFCLPTPPAWLAPDGGLETYSTFINGLEVEDVPFRCF
jgi:aminopeptidase N